MLASYQLIVLHVNVLMLIPLLSLFRMLDPVILGYGKGQLTGFPFDPNAVIDVVSFIA